MMPDEATQSFYAGRLPTDDAQRGARRTGVRLGLAVKRDVQEMPAAPEMIAPHYPVEPMQPIDRPHCRMVSVERSSRAFAAPTAIFGP